jgi:hypothetical protein
VGMGDVWRSGVEANSAEDTNLGVLSFLGI